MSLLSKICLFSAVVLTSAELEGDLLDIDDECMADQDEACALNALQKRGLRAAAQGARAATVQRHTVDDSSSWSPGSCQSYGCHQGYRAEFSCQCNDQCSQHGNCCSDFQGYCKRRSHSLHASPQQPSQNGGTSGATGGGSAYKLNWVAQGDSFFNQWSFLTEDMNHGSAEFLPKGDAVSAGVAQTYGSHAILRAGKASPRYLYKRQTAKISTGKSWKYMLATMKYSHVPYGCGTWPAFFTLGQGGEWPGVGEVDILEYVNMDRSKASVHVGEGCRLDAGKVNEFGSMPDRNNMNYECRTNYPNNLGCAPNKWMKSGQGWAHSPGVLAMEWTKAFVKIFYIPMGEIPADLESDAPKPETWNRWLFSYYPFAESGCSPDVMKAQALVMQIGFCGDWASKVWHLDPQCKPMIHGCRSVDPLAEYAPQQDCCTQFIWDKDQQHGTDGYLHDKAFFNISYVKVFQQR